MSTPGRPTSYRPEYAQLARNYCQLGATNAQLADFFGVASRTIDNWIVNFHDFGEAVRGARSLADERVWRAVYQRAIGYDYKVERTVRRGDQEMTETRTVHCKADLRAAMIWFRNRGAWVAGKRDEPEAVPAPPGPPQPPDGAGGPDAQVHTGPIPDPWFTARQQPFDAGVSDEAAAGGSALPKPNATGEGVPERSVLRVAPRRPLLASREGLATNLRAFLSRTSALVHLVRDPSGGRPPGFFPVDCVPAPS